jgi:hypothetical protein
MEAVALTQTIPEAAVVAEYLYNGPVGIAHLTALLEQRVGPDIVPYMRVPVRSMSLIAYGMSCTMPAIR